MRTKYFIFVYIYIYELIAFNFKAHAVSEWAPSYDRELFCVVRPNKNYVARSYKKLYYVYQYFY